MRTVLHAFVLALCFTLASCSSSSGSSAKGGGDPTGMWVGDFGPAFYDRNTISLELKWDGKELTGSIKPGVQGRSMYREFKPFPIENASFDPETGAMKFEAVYNPRGRRYLIEATLVKNTLSGTWIRPEEKRSGDFKLSRQ